MTDCPPPTNAPSPQRIDLVAVLVQFRDRIPLLIAALDRLTKAIPGFARDSVLGGMSPERWVAISALLREPADILDHIARLCREQAQSDNPSS